MLEILNLHKRSLATLLLAIMAMLMLAGCSSSDEAAQEDTGGGQAGCEGLPPDQMEACIQDLPL
jgi:uncharacterized lipoprotein